jgi:hypothetical protein
MNTSWVFSGKYSGKFLKKLIPYKFSWKNSGKFLNKLNEPNSCNFLRRRTELLLAVNYVPSAPLVVIQIRAEGEYLGRETKSPAAHMQILSVCPFVRT